MTHGAARVLVHNQGLDSPDRLRIVTNKNVDNMFNVIRKSGSKSKNG